MKHLCYILCALFVATAHASEAQEVSAYTLTNITRTAIGAPILAMGTWKAGQHLKILINAALNTHAFQEEKEAEEKKLKEIQQQQQEPLKQSGYSEKQIQALHQMQEQFLNKMLNRGIICTANVLVASLFAGMSYGGWKLLPKEVRTAAVMNCQSMVDFIKNTLSTHTSKA